MNTVTKEAIGVISISNTMQLVVLEVEEGIETRVKTQYVSIGTGLVGKPGWNKVEIEASGRSFFKKNKVKYYLDEIMLLK